MKVSHSVRNLARHKVIGSIEDYSTQEQKRKDRLRLSVQRISMRRKTLAMPYAFLSEKVVAE